MPKLDLTDKTVVVTGGTGFWGSHLVKQLKREKPEKIIVPSSKEYDLRQAFVCRRLFQGVDIVIHLAGRVGGIGYNKENPAIMFYDNILLATHGIHEAWKAGVEKFVAIGTVCSYPKHTPVPFKEENLWNGYPEETNAPFGLAKRIMLVQAQAYRAQYGFNAVYLLPVNLYGPGDKFDPKQSHVIPALIKKFIEAKNKNQPEVVVWGTGKATREFLYVEDAARGIILATKYYNKPEPVNLGSGREISIRDLAFLISEIVGFEGKIVFDKTKPDGQPRRKLDITKAKEEFDFVAEVKFEEGLRKTIEWYKRTIGV